MSKTLKNAFACLLSFVMLFVFTACDSNEKSKKNGDYISGNKWASSSGMLLSLESDKSFKWYSNKSNRTDNYYSGTYETYVGDDAVNYLEKQSGATRQSQLDAMNQYGVALKEYYIVMIKNEECVMNGQNSLEKENEVAYVGFYNEEFERFTMQNLTTGVEYIFTKM